jgi:hypothetical protein
MSIILGTMTTVNVDGTTVGFQSINWSIDRQPNRLWQLGNWMPYRTQVGATISISLTTYAHTLLSVTLAPATSCANSTATKRIRFSASACGPGESVSIDEVMYINSYSYAKEDPTGFGTESWSFQKWVNPQDYGTLPSSDFILIGVPTYVLQGVTEGNVSGDVGNGRTDMGIHFKTPESTHVVTGQTGSVSAGFPGLGNADEISLGIVDVIGGALLEAGGRTGRSSATVPHQPLYMA